MRNALPAATTARLILTPIMTLMLMILLGGCTRLYFLTLNAGTPPQPVETRVYDVSQHLALDIYRPRRSNKPAPVVVFFYGGRWQRGSRLDYAYVGERLAAQGVLTVIADYRRFPQVKFPDFVEDAARAVRWTRDHAVELGGDAQRLFIAGHSAGAHLAAMLGTDARFLAREGLPLAEIAGVIGISGPYDFLPLDDDDLIEIFGADSQSQAASQPVNFVDGDEPPFLLLHGDADWLVWPRNSRRLFRRLRAENEHATLIRYPGVGHIRIVTAIRYPRLAPTLVDVMDFIGRH